MALPAIMRSGASGPENFQVGSMPPAQQQITSGQMHRGHMPPLVRVHPLPPGYQAFLPPSPRPRPSAGPSQELGSLFPRPCLYSCP